MAPIPGEHELAQSVIDLAAHVEDLTEKLRISDEEAARSEEQVARITAVAKWLTALSVAALLIALGCVGLWIQVGNQADANKNAQIQACKNTNQTRQGNLLLWKTILNANKKDPKNQTAKRRAQTKAFNDWIDKLFAEHDCNHLNRHYPIPAPPDLSS